MTEFVRSTPTARKPHVCDLCGRTIRQGEKYMRGAGLDNGTAWTWRECRHCDAALQIWTHEIQVDAEYGPIDFQEWEPRTISGLRAKINYSRKWTRRDGTLVEMPAEVSA